MINRAVRMNYHTNLLELEEHMYPLVDVETPNVFHNLFPYTEIPKIAFNDRIVPHHMPDDIWITDTTFRDGQQSRAPYSTQQIVTIYDYLHRAPQVAVSNTSGLAGIAHWINNHFRLEQNRQVDKNSELVAMVKAWVDAQYEEGRVTVLTDEELLTVIAECCNRLGITLGEG